MYLHWSNGMSIQIKKWGNSSAVRIPADVMAAAGLSVEDAVTIREEGGKVVIERSMQRTFDLDAAVAAITAENIHDDTDWGPPIGKEVW
jgi:antitoxin MazE